MAFGLRYYAELRSEHKEVFWRVEISERGFVGAAEEMHFDGNNPLSITWERRGDEYNSELVEMPKLLQKETPSDGDDCIVMANLPFVVKTAIRCENQIIILAANNIYRYDTASETIVEVCSVTANDKIFAADGGFAIVNDTTIRILDYRGVVIRTVAQNEFLISPMATYMGGYVYVLRYYTGREERPILYYYLLRPEFKFTSLTYRRGFGEPFTSMYRQVELLVKSYSSIAINTDQRAYLHDRRSNLDMTMYSFENGTEIISMSDYFLCVNYPSQFRIYRRDTISFADHTLGEVAYQTGNTLSIWTYRNNTTRTVKNLAGASKPLKGLFYINGELHIVRENQIFKYISNGTI